MVVPDGLLNQTTMLTYVKEQCIVKAVVSLPTRTFYATPKKTYILIVSKKRDVDIEEAEPHPIFTYLVSETGETRDANRWTIPNNDLNEAAALYNQFKGSPNTFRSSAPRCRVVAWAKFDAFDHWMLDRHCWTSGELRELGIGEEAPEPLTIEQFNALLQGVKVPSIRVSRSDISKVESAEVLLNDKSLFRLRIGKRVLKRDCVDDGIPCISANVQDVFGYISQSFLIDDFSVPSLTWGIDGNFDWYLIPAKYRFHPTDHCGVLRVVNENIDPEYLYHSLRSTKTRHGFDRTYRANLTNVGRVSVEIPVRKDGSYDMDAQLEIAKTFRTIDDKRTKAMRKLQEVLDAQVSII